MLPLLVEVPVLHKQTTHVQLCGFGELIKYKTGGNTPRLVLVLVPITGTSRRFIHLAIVTVFSITHS